MQRLRKSQSTGALHSNKRSAVRDLLNELVHSAASPDYLGFQGCNQVGCQRSLQEDQKTKIQRSAPSPVVCMFGDPFPVVTQPPWKGFLVSLFILVEVLLFILVALLATFSLKNLEQMGP